MFEIELLELLNEYKKTTSDYELNKIKSSISKLISQNEEQYQKFQNNPALDEQTKQILKQCEKQIIDNHINQINNATEKQTDFDNIKKFYSQWLTYYQNNNRQIDQNCNNIVDQILNFYMINRFDIIEKILNITDTQDYEIFKNHIKNRIRLQFLQKIKEYMQTDAYRKMFFLKKIRKKNEINSLLDDLDYYKFDSKRFEEVLK